LELEADKGGRSYLKSLDGRRAERVKKKAPERAGKRGKTEEVTYMRLTDG